MKTKNEITTNYFSSIESDLNLKSSTRYLTKQIRTPYEQRNNGLSDDMRCYLPNDTSQILISFSKLCEAKLIQENKLYIPSSNEMLSELANWNDIIIVENLFRSECKTVSELITLMEEEQKTIYCIDETSVRKACELVEARTNVLLLNKYWQKLPNGKEDRDYADYTFEVICSELKIPRRTREVIKRKKAKELQNINAPKELIISTNTIEENESGDN